MNSWLWIFLWVLLLATPSWSDPDPSEYDELARSRLQDPQIVSNAFTLWLNAAGAALGRQDWREAYYLADQAWLLYRHLDEEKPGIASEFRQQAGLIKMAQARALAEQQDDQNAADLYRQSAELHPDHRAWTSAGQLAGRMEEWHQARRDFESALQLPEVSPEVHLRLGEVLYQLGETERAIEEVELGIGKGASREQGEAFLERFRREAGVEEGYSRGGTTHFRITFEDVRDQQDFRRRVEASLERVYEPACRFFGIYPRNRVPVVIYPSTSTYQAASEAPNWSAAVYNGKIRIPTGDLVNAEESDLDRILAHEFAHFLIEKQAGQGAPAWLQEGLAQHVEAGGEPPPWLPKFFRSLLRGHQGKSLPFTLKELEGSFHGVNGEAVRVAYGISYYAVGALLEAPGKFRVENLMAALKAGLAPEAALQQECFLDYVRLQEKWLGYARRHLDLD